MPADPTPPTRRGLSPRAKIELWHVALALFTLAALVAILL
jgi:hypothetical protein